MAGGDNTARLRALSCHAYLSERPVDVHRGCYSKEALPFKYPFPHLHISSRIGTSVFPKSVNEYSVLGGTTG